MRSAAPLDVGHLALEVSARVPLGDVAPTIVLLLAPGERELDLGVAAAIVEVDAQRDEREALGARTPLELVDLDPVEQQLAVPPGLVVVAVAARPRGDVCADEPSLALLDARVRVLEVRPGRRGCS